MIKYNLNTINDWNFGDDNIIKVYRNNAICYYKITGGGDTPTAQTPCFAVVDDISQYSDTEFEDVFNKADNKWYKLNNLNQYEEYGIYGSGRTITTYDGKLTIDNGYEYMYSGGSWVNVGEVSGSTIIIKSPEYIEKDSSHNGKINLDYVWKTNSKMQFKFYSTNNGGGAMIGEDGVPDNNDCRMFFGSTTAYFDWGSSRIYWSSNGRKNTLYEYEYGNYYIKNMVTSTSKTGSTISTSRTNTLYFGLGGTDRFRTYYLKFYDGDTLVKDFIPWTDMNGNYGLFDKVSLSVYNVASGTLTGSSNVTDVEVGGGYIYPLEYVVREDPPDNLVFSSMAEAEAYECPWVGMKATIDGDNYIFSGDSISGYEWVYNPSRLPVGYTEVEYVQNTGTSYLNTNFVPNQDTRVVCDMQNVTASNYPRLWGAGAYNSANGLIIDYDPNTFQVSWLGNTSWTNYSAYPTSTSYNRHTYDLNKNYMYIDETLVGSNTYTTRTASDPIGVFTHIGSGRPSSSSYWGQEHFKGKMYSFKVYDNGTLVRDLVPCIRDNDNTVGAYDIVNDVFYTVPSGYTTDKLVAGNPV